MPVPGSTITQSPPQIRLVFSEGIELLGTRVSLLDAQNNAVALDEAQLDPADTDNRTLRVGVPATLAAGTYTVQWKNLSVDGHSEKGTYSFTLNLSTPTATTVPAVTPARTSGARDVTLKFALKAGQADVACDKDIADLGTQKNTAHISGAWLYLSNIKLLSSDGKAVPLQLTPDNKWQSKDVALLDFENAVGLCKATGSSDTRTIVVGKLPAGQYTGITFDLGVPAALNHASITSATAPLNQVALWSNRQNGYKFARIDLHTDAIAPNNIFFMRLGSLGCGKVATAAQKPCANPNLAQVKLAAFDPDADILVADLAALLTGVDLAESKPMPAGCLPNANDPNCAALFANLGMALATGQCLDACAGATFFRVEAAKL